MKRLGHCIFLIGLVLTGSARADALLAILPAPSSVERVLREHPTVLAGLRGIESGQADRRRLEAGSYEWTVRTQQQERRAMPMGQADARFREWNLALERPLRLNGKAQLDDELGSLSEATAMKTAEDLRHEVARELLRRWFAWLRENALEKQWTAQHESIDRQARGIARRVELGDASRIELAQVEAAQAQVAAQLAQTRERRQMSERGLRQHFPGLPLTLPADLPSPTEILTPAEQLIDDLLAHNHELALALAESRRAELTASRNQRDRLPDPTLGLQFGSERSGEEKLLAAYISWPLPGAGRHAAAESSSAQAAAVQLKTEALRRRLTAEAATLVHSAQMAKSHWQLAQQAANHQEKVAAMSLRAWQLGEGSLNDLLLAGRMANEVRITARIQQLEALELNARLKLDAHQLWQSLP